MRFWIREVLGWLLVLVGLGIFGLCVLMVANRMILELGPMTLVGIIVFRGGIHLLKVAVAARICLQTQERAAQATKGTVTLPQATRKAEGVSRP
jgi:hypothetical protein